jgi:hypothetical protein
MRYLNVNIQSTKTKYCTYEIRSQTLPRNRRSNRYCSLRYYGNYRLLISAL